MAEEDIDELGFATYPPEGQESAGYTFALIIDAGEEKIDWVVDTMGAILNGLWDKMHHPVA